MIHIIDNPYQENKIDAMIRYIESCPDEKYIYFGNDAEGIAKLKEKCNFEHIEHIKNDLPSAKERIIAEIEEYFNIYRKIPKDFNVVLEKPIPIFLLMCYNDLLDEYKFVSYTEQVDGSANFRDEIQDLCDSEVIEVKKDGTLKIKDRKRNKRLIYNKFLDTIDNDDFCAINTDKNNINLFCTRNTRLDEFKNVFIFDYLFEEEQFFKYILELCGLTYDILYVKDGKLSFDHDDSDTKKLINKIKAFEGVYDKKVKDKCIIKYPTWDCARLNFCIENYLYGKGYKVNYFRYYYSEIIKKVAEQDCSISEVYIFIPLKELKDSISERFDIFNSFK